MHIYHGFEVYAYGRSSRYMVLLDEFKGYDMILYNLSVHYSAAFTRATNSSTYCKFASLFYSIVLVLAHDAALYVVP